MSFKRISLLLVIICVTTSVFGQRIIIDWSKDGSGYVTLKDGNITKVDPRKDISTILVGKEQLTPAGATAPLVVQSFNFNTDNTQLLLFVNTAKVWRYNTRGDYWVYDFKSSTLRQLGKGLPSQSLMFAKFSPDGKNVA